MIDKIFKKKMDEFRKFQKYAGRLSTPNLLILYNILADEVEKRKTKAEYE